MSEQQTPGDIEMFRALFLLAGIHVQQHYELPNRYWPEVYADMRAAHPWALMLTAAGPIVIGWRKRVISISWADTKIRAVVTADDTTKEETMVHAWSYTKALEYLTTLNAAICKAAPPANENGASTTNTNTGDFHG